MRDAPERPEAPQNALQFLKQKYIAIWNENAPTENNLFTKTNNTLTVCHKNYLGHEKWGK